MIQLNDPNFVAHFGQLILPCCWCATSVIHPRGSTKYVSLHRGGVSEMLLSPASSGARGDFLLSFGDKHWVSSVKRGSVHFGFTFGMWGSTFDADATILLYKKKQTKKNNILETKKEKHHCPKQYSVYGATESHTCIFCNDKQEDPVSLESRLDQAAQHPWILLAKF